MNAIAPFVLNVRLKPLMERNAPPELALHQGGVDDVFVVCYLFEPRFLT